MFKKSPLLDPTKDPQKGNWMIRKDDIINKQTGKQYTAVEIKEKWSLAEVPDTIVDVKPEATTKVRVGEAAGRADGNEWGKGGGRQWEMDLPPDEIKKDWFTNQQAL